MTNDNITKTREVLNMQYRALLTQIKEVALAEPLEPRGNYKYRVAQRIIEKSNGLCERDIFTEFRDHPEMSRIVRLFHNIMVDLPLDRLAGAVDEYLQTRVTH